MTEFDPAKDRANIRLHGVSLARWIDLEILFYREDDRRDYGEKRYRAWGTIEGVAHCLVFTVREGRVRPISLRRAHEKEIKRYAPQS